MMNRKWKMIRITLLVLVSLPVVWFACVLAIVSIAGSYKWSEVVSDHSKWPKDLQRIVQEAPSASIVYYRLRSGFESGMTDRGIIRIDGESHVESFIQSAKLEAVDTSHPKRKEFEDSLVLAELAETPDGNLWFASPGFGTIHQEIVDLYLLLTTADKHTAIVYHYWTF